MLYRNSSIEITSHHLLQERGKNPLSKSTSMHLNHKRFPLMSPQAKKKKIESNKELELADVHFHTMDEVGKCLFHSCWRRFIRQQFAFP